jgi:hypothetical protein
MESFRLFSHVVFRFAQHLHGGIDDALLKHLPGVGLERIPKRGRESGLLFQAVIEAGRDAPEQQRRDRACDLVDAAVRELDDRKGPQRGVPVREPLVERVFGPELFGQCVAREGRESQKTFDVFVFQAGYLDPNAADPARLPEEMPEITHADQVNLVDAEAGRLLGMGGQGRRVEELVIANDPSPVEALLLPDKLAMHDAHQFQLDIRPADEVAVDFALEVPQGIGEMRQRVPSF